MTSLCPLISPIFRSTTDTHEHLCRVVPVYSAIFSAAHHPSILRLLHIDGAAYDALDFVTNLLIFCLQLRNAGLSDGGLVAHLSEAVASGLTGVGHSTAYGEDASY